MSEHGEHGFAHPQPVGMLLGVFAALVLLTIITVLQTHLPLGNWEIWASLLIASVKASLVMYFFMHLGWDKPFNVLVFLSSAFFLSLFLGFTLMDKSGYTQSLELEIDEAYVLPVGGEGEEGAQAPATGEEADPPAGTSESDSEEADLEGRSEGAPGA